MEKCGYGYSINVVFYFISSCFPYEFFNTLLAGLKNKQAPKQVASIELGMVVVLKMSDL